jgi:ABC-type Fe2+-enterobactin transport system substrate-binding protein
MKQYEETDTTAPKITVNRSDKQDQQLEKRIRDLADLVASQQKQIDRMHRDIVRLRSAINDVAARIK